MSHTPARATGYKEVRGDAAYVVLTRTFHAPIEDVWAAVTESDRLGRWIGTWTGDPASGQVEFLMTAEGAVEPQTHYIDACEPPRRLATHSSSPMDPDQAWHLTIDLAEVDGVTTLTFGQVMSDAVPVESVGPGWDYYLDRLVAAESGDDVSALDFNDYYPAFAEHYRQAFA